MTSVSRNEFNKIYQEQLLPILEKLEARRVRVNIILNILTTLAIISLILDFVFVYMGFSLISSGSILGAFCLAFMPVPFLFGVPAIGIYYSYRSAIKKDVISKLLPIFGDFQLSSRENLITLKEVHSFGLFKSLTYKSDSDNIVGQYKGCNVLINECELGGDSGFVFHGFILKAQLKKPFIGMTVAGGCDIVTPFMGSEKVELESVLFSSAYSVYSTNQVEARYLLTPSFMEKLQVLYNIFKNRAKNTGKFRNREFDVSLNSTSVVSIVFLAGYVYLFIPSTFNFFELDYFKTFLNQDTLYEIFQELSLILSVIDYFDMDQNAGL